MDSEHFQHVQSSIFMWPTGSWPAFPNQTHKKSVQSKIQKLHALPSFAKRNYLLGGCFGWWRWLTMVGIENWRSKPAETRLNDALQFAIPSNRLQWRASQKIRLQVIIDDPAFRSYDVSAHHHITSHVWKNEPFKLPFIINFKGKGRLVTWEASSPNVSMELVMPESPVMGALVVRRR